MRRLAICLTGLLALVGLGSSLCSAQESRDSANNGVQAVLSGLESAWAAGNASEFAAAFSEEADFVPYFGIHVHGREQIANAHQPVFDGFLKGTRLHYTLQTVRPLGKGILLVHTLGAVSKAGSTDPKPTPTALQSFVMVMVEGRLVIESFQNTVIQVPPGPPDKH